MARRIFLLLAFLLLAAAPAQARTPAFTGTPSERSAVVWAIGDGASDKPDSVRLAQRIAADRPARVLYLGDVYERGTPEEFEEQMTGVYGRLLSRMLPTPGNHEWGNHAIGYDPFWQTVTGRRTPRFYSVSIAGWTVFSLNSETEHRRDGKQVTWLRRRLSGARGTCRMAFWHRPYVSAGLGDHGDQPDMAPLWEALRGQASLVLAGHDHNLQRLHPIDGMVQVVSGAAGRGHHPVDGADGRLAFSNDKAYGALRMVVRRGSVSLTFVDVDGVVLDRSRVTCRTP